MECHILLAHHAVSRDPHPQEDPREDHTPRFRAWASDVALSNAIAIPGAVRCPFDTGKQHGPTCDPRGIDCGCGWGDLCTAERGYFTGRPYTLCGALRYQRIASHRAPATALSSWQRPWSR